jgi:hypothetical protein
MRTGNAAQFASARFAFVGHNGKLPCNAWTDFAEDGRKRRRCDGFQQRLQLLSGNRTRLVQEIDAELVVQLAPLL